MFNRTKYATPTNVVHCTKRALHLMGIQKIWYFHYFQMILLDPVFFDRTRASVDLNRPFARLQLTGGRSYFNSGLSKTGFSSSIYSLVGPLAYLFVRARGPIRLVGFY